MDNIVVKMEPNCKNKSFLDHIYCHPNDNNYIRANTGASDVISLVKENKHLKAMLLLHLDLIQEQSDQILSKDKQISGLKEENDSLKTRLERLERKNHLRNQKADILPISSPSSIIPSNIPSVEIRTTPATTQLLNNSTTSTNIIGCTNLTTTPIVKKFDDKKENIPDLKLNEPKITLTSSTINLQPPQQKQQKKQISSKVNNTASTSCSSPSTTVAVVSQKNKYKICDEAFKHDSIIGESNGKLISKIVLQRVQIADVNSFKKIESAATRQQLQHQLLKHQKKQKHQQQQQKLQEQQDEQQQQQQEQLEKEQQQQSKNEEKQNELCEISDDKKLIKKIKESLPDHSEKYEKLVLNIKVEDENHNADDTSQSLGHIINEQQSDQLVDINQRKRKRLGFMTTNCCYRTREWEDEQIIDETNKEEAEALKSEAPNLEIPKWSIKEFTGLYSIEGTEDLSDDLFLKRHAKFELDEKRRKKWDVQRIREQRTIERLKRRHYKEEIQNENENQEIISFYPTLDQIKFIQLTEDLPVQAFGDCIPRIPSSEFNLPWHNDQLNTNIFSGLQSKTVTPSTSQYVDSYDPNTSFILLVKKKRRLQSQGTSGGSGGSKKNRKFSLNFTYSSVATVSSPNTSSTNK